MPGAPDLMGVLAFLDRGNEVSVQHLREAGMVPLGQGQRQHLPQPLGGDGEMVAGSLVGGQQQLGDELAIENDVGRYSPDLFRRARFGQGGVVRVRESARIAEHLPIGGDQSDPGPQFGSDQMENVGDARSGMDDVLGEPVDRQMDPGAAVHD